MPHECDDSRHPNRFKMTAPASYKPLHQLVQRVEPRQVSDLPDHVYGFDGCMLAAMSIAAQHLRAALHCLRQLPETSPSAAAAAELALQLLETEADFGKLLRQRRDAADLSISELAKLAQIAEGTIKNLEAGRNLPSADTLERLLAVDRLRLPAESSSAAPAEIGPNSYLLPYYNRRQLLQDLAERVNSPGGALEQTMLYLDDESAGDWLALSKAAVSWGSFRSLPIAALAEAILREGRGVPLDINALGAGDGRSEVRLCEELLALDPSLDLRLHLLDISHPLLHAAYEHARSVLGDRVQVATLHGNFHYLGRFSVLLPQGSPARRRVYSLVGHTMSNLDNEVAWIRDHLGLAGPGDLMIADYSEAYASPDDPESIKALDPPLSMGVPAAHMDWLLGPIRRYGREVADINLAIELNPYCPMPGSYELATYATVRRRDGSSQRYLLTRVRRYHTDKLKSCLQALGWAWQTSISYGSTGRAVVALLRRTGA